MLEAPVSSYRRGRGVVPSSHRLAVDMPVGHRLWREADAVLAVGTRFLIQNGSWGIDRNLKVVRLDIDPDEHARFAKPDVALVGDAAIQLRALIAALPGHNRARASRAQELAGHRAWLSERLSRLEPQLSFLKAIRAALPEDGIFVDEVSQIGFASRVALPIERPRTFLSPGYQDNLGWGFGTALGAKAAMPDRKVLAIAGDGGFMYQVGELATAARHNLAVVVVVFDNGGFGNVKRIQQEQYGNRLIASDLQNPDFCKLADSFGIASFKALDARQLEDCLYKAFALNAPALVWVPHGDVPSPWDLIMLPRVRG
jgi:acetolactate synthase-1/2/3 large subunit